MYQFVFVMCVFYSEIKKEHFVKIEKRLKENSNVYFYISVRIACPSYICGQFVLICLHIPHFYHVSKAFDSVWTDGLFFQLHKIGMKGNLWRLLYKSYQDFECCVRLGSKDSNYYTMECGIHQGGYLSLVKYTAYIDSLITLLEQSNLCCDIYRIKSSPVRYADDMAACTTSKRRMDQVMEKVHQLGCDWRYSFNAGKKAQCLLLESPLKIGNTGLKKECLRWGEKESRSDSFMTMWELKRV